MRAEHHTVDNEGVLVTEELRETYRDVMAFEGIVFGDFAAGGKGAAECGDPLDVAAELDLLDKEGIASPAILGSLVGEVGFVLCREFHCGDEDGVVGHSVLL
jgi:hypothetical protein